MSPVVKGLLLYYSAINLALFIAMGLDKRKAKNHAWRTPEATLIWLAFLGGGLGGILGMQLFRHKTQKTKFRICFPLALLLHAAAWAASLLLLH